MTRKYRVDYILVCDDVRREESRKEIIIGLYSSYDIIFESLPATIPMLTFRVQFRFLERIQGHVQFQIRGPKGNILFDVEGEVEAQPSPPVSAAVFQRIPCSFAEEGSYDLLFGIDEKPRKIGAFRVVDRSKQQNN